MAFSFGFSGDDIDMDDSEVNDGVPEIVPSRGTTNSLPELVKACRHDIDEWLSILPSQIYYNRLPIGNPPIVIARREIFDIRTQLMAEDNEKYDNAELIAGLEEGDLKPQFYEGGFKTWECALDLAKLVSEDNEMIESLNDSQTTVHLIELGAGTAVPSLTLFAHILAQTSPTENIATVRPKAHFTFADYNDAVLRLVTLPNLILTWQNSRQQILVEENPAQTSSRSEQDEELDITPELVAEFRNDLAQRGITIDLISGAWSPEFVDLVFSQPGLGNCRTLVLASETIYSPATLLPFSETLVALLRRSGTQANRTRALIAAKKVYFGVGGGVDEFIAVLKSVCGDELHVEQRLDVQSEGVGRVVLEVEPCSNGV